MSPGTPVTVACRPHQPAERRDCQLPPYSPLYWQSEQDEFVVDTSLRLAADCVTMTGLAVNMPMGTRPCGVANTDT